MVGLGEGGEGVATGEHTAAIPHQQRGRIDGVTRRSAPAKGVGAEPSTAAGGTTFGDPACSNPSDKAAQPSQGLATTKDGSAGLVCAPSHSFMRPAQLTVPSARARRGQTLE